MSGASDDLETFTHLAECWGGDLERWPEDRRAWGRAMALKPEAAALLAEARRLDARLDGFPLVTEARASATAGDVAARIAQERARRAQPWWSLLTDALFTRGGSPSLAAYACLALAVASGALLGAAAPFGAPDEQEVALRLFVGDAVAPFEAERSDALSLEVIIR